MTLRKETEWVETVQAGWNVLVGAKTEKILSAVKNWTTPEGRSNFYGDGSAAETITEILGEYCKESG